MSREQRTTRRPWGGRLLALLGLAALLVGPWTPAQAQGGESWPRESWSREVGQRLIVCGDLQFRRIDTRSYADLAARSDAAADLDRLIRIAGLSEAEIDALGFDLWAHTGSGLTLAVPEGLGLRAEGEYCIARTPDGESALWVSGATSESIPDVEWQAEQLQRDLAAEIGVEWDKDPAFSQIKPRNRLDGFAVLPRSFVGRAPRGGEMKAYAFEALLSRGSTHVGLAAVQRDYAPLVWARCKGDWDRAECAGEAAAYRRWVALVLAVQLSTSALQ